MIDYRRLLRDIRENPDLYTLRNYHYTLIGDGLVTTGTVIYNLAIDASAPFVWTKTNYYADLAGAALTDATRVIPAALLQMTDSGSAQPFFDAPQPISAMAGHDGLPLVLEAPYVFNASSSINAVFTGVSAAQTYTRLRVSLIGYRVFQFSGPAGYA